MPFLRHFSTHMSPSPWFSHSTAERAQNPVDRKETKMISGIRRSAAFLVIHNVLLGASASTSQLTFIAPFAEGFTFGLPCHAVQQMGLREDATRRSLWLCTRCLMTRLMEVVGLSISLSLVFRVQPPPTHGPRPIPLGWISTMRLDGLHSVSLGLRLRKGRGKNSSSVEKVSLDRD